MRPRGTEVLDVIKHNWMTQSMLTSLSSPSLGYWIWSLTVQILSAEKLVLVWFDGSTSRAVNWRSYSGNFLCALQFEGGGVDFFLRLDLVCSVGWNFTSESVKLKVHMDSTKFSPPLRDEFENKGIDACDNR